jgi:hypothetical protein
MIRNNIAQTILRSTALSAGLLLMTVPAAMARDLAQAQHTCTVLGLNPSEAPYAACVRSLDLDPQSQGNETTASRNLRAALWNEENIGAR